LLLVAEGRADLLPDDCFHRARHLVSHWVQKLGLCFLLFGAQGTHGDEFAKKPRVSLPQLSQFDVHQFLIDDVDQEIAETLVQLDAIRVRVSRLLDGFLLRARQPPTNPDLLSGQIESRETACEFFVQLVVLEFGVF